MKSFKTFLIILITIIYILTLIKLLSKPKQISSSQISPTPSSILQEISSPTPSPPSISSNIPFSPLNNNFMNPYPFKIGILPKPQPFTNQCGDTNPNSISSVDYQAPFNFCNQCLWFNESP